MKTFYSLHLLLAAFLVNTALAVPYATYIGNDNQTPADPTGQGWTISGGLQQGFTDATNSNTLGWELNDNNSEANPTMYKDYGSANVPQAGDSWSLTLNARVIAGNGSATNVLQYSNGSVRYLCFIYEDLSGNIDILYWNSSGASTTLQDYTVNDDAFHNWAIVHNGTSASLTYDGANVATLGSISASGQARGVHIGGGSSSGQGALYVANVVFDATLASGSQTTNVGRVFADHMVLQRNEPVKVFGTDSVNPGSQAISVSFAGQTKNTTTDGDGKWEVTLDPMAANATGQNLVVTGSSVKTITDVLIGEVWLAAGQSNMNWRVNQSSTSPDATKYPLIRMCNWEGSVGTGSGQVYGSGDFANLTPENFYSGTWQAMDASTVAAQSGVAYFFAQNLAADLNVPIGIVDTSIGGTSTESYISPAAHASSPHLTEAFERPHLCTNLGQWTGVRLFKNVYNNNVANYTHADPTLPHPHPYAPGFLYYTGIEHLKDFAFKGAIWYQGESNAEFTDGKYKINGNRLADYQTEVMKTLINDWRSAFGKPQFPFYMVQLPRINASSRAMWPFYREAQARVAKDLEGVELATVMEYGANGSDVHPPNKEPVGERLAAIARAKLYGDAITYSSPVYSGHIVAGNKIILSFDHLGGGLVDIDGGALEGFEISGSDRNFVAATATIVGDTIEVTAASVSDPVAVRHAWEMNADVDLYNADGFSSSSFRTDKWIAAPGRKLKVACIGDSITFGLGISPTSDNYTSQLQNILGTTNFEVQNFGHSGAGIYRTANRYDNQTAYTNAIAWQPDVVICNLGINDITEWGFSKDDFETEYFQLVDNFIQSGNTPLFLQWNKIAPLYPGQTFYGSPNLDPLNEWIKEAAANTNTVLFDMETPLSGHADWFPDNIHPNAAGAREIAETTFCQLSQLGDLDSKPVITEFMAVNVSDSQDEDGDFSDWIEISNTGTSGACLNNHYLSNNTSNLTQWQIPSSTVVEPGGHIIVYASAKDRAVNAAPLHTNFTLSDTGGSLLLVDSDGVTTLDSFNPYPSQYPDISYGITGTTVTVPINNGGFENYDSGVGSTSALASDWTVADIAGVNYGPLRQAWTTTKSEGSYSYLVNATQLNQTLASNLEADKTYTLRIGLHKGTSGSAVSGYDVEIHAGAHTVAALDNTQDLSQNSVTYRELVFTTTPSTNGVGSPIEIELRADGGFYLGLDDISLTYEDTSITPQARYLTSSSEGAANSPSGSLPFEMWKTYHGVTADSSDDDNDGLSAFMEFVTGSSPTDQSANSRPQPSITNDGANDHLTISFNVANNLAGLNYTIEYSDDLITAPVWETDASAAMVNSVDNGNGSSTLTYRLSMTKGSADKLFSRINYTYSE